MTPERRYGEEEVAEILRRATETLEAPVSAWNRAEGLTLSEIQEIGSEVGIEPARIEHAARSLQPLGESGAEETRWLGARRSVSRVVPLERDLSDDEWTRLVVLLRETFDARGTVETVGRLRTWYNGNLHVHVEPHGDGHRVRMHTLKGNVVEMSTVGGVFLFMAIFIGLLIFLKRGIDPGLIMSAVFGVAGVGVLGATRLSLPRWASERTEQMENIADELPRLMSE